MRPSHRHILGLALLVLLIVIGGCDTMVQDEQEPPELIPSEAFALQADLFNQRRSGKATIDPHFMAAVMRVWPVTTTLEPRLRVPARLTRAALDQTPTIQGEAWVWAGTTLIDGDPLSFTLTGRPMGEEVDWTMEIAEPSTSSASDAPALLASDSTSTPSSADTSARNDVGATSSTSPVPDSTDGNSSGYGPEAHDAPARERAAAPSTGIAARELPLSAVDSSFVLYTAQTSAAGAQGRWRLFDAVDSERVNVLNGQYKIEKANKIKLVLTIPASAPEHGGDSIVYAQDDDQRRLHWGRADAGQTHRVRWNVRSHEGSVTASNYNRGKAACWGKQLDNVDCTE